MFTLKLENTQGETVELTGNEERFQVISVTGLNPPNANIRVAEVAGMDGSKYSSAKLNDREIVITVRINGDVEANRLRLYRFTRTKQWCKIYYKNGTRDVYIEGYVHTNECDLFTISEQMQVSILCPDPYFQDMVEIVTDISQVLGAFVFPFAFGAEGVKTPTITDPAIEFSTYSEDRIVTINNLGGDGTGLIITITAKGTVTNPIIYNAETQEYFAIRGTFEQNDVITINTNFGQKSISLLHNGAISNLINKVDKGSTWLNLRAGDNLFIYEAEEGASDMIVKFAHRTRYEAV